MSIADCRLPIADCREGSQLADSSPPAVRANRKSEIGNRKSHGFTLVEMLVVISIMVLAMGLAIPAIRSLTGSRSQEAAQNTLTSFLNSVRTEAMGLQRIEGVMFLLDTNEDRIKCVAVMQAAVPAANGAVYLDVVPDRDPFSLPPGIRLWTMKDAPPANAGLTLPDPMQGARYLGYSPVLPNTSNGQTPGYNYGGLSTTLPTLPAIPGGVILFDGSGRLVTTRYGFHLVTSGASGPMLTGLGQLIYSSDPNPPLSSISDWPAASGAAANDYLASQIGLVMFDKESFLNQRVSGGAEQFQDDNDPASGSQLESAMEAWLDANTTPIFVNRYDGSLMRAE